MEHGADGAGGLFGRDRALAILSHEIRTPLNGVLGMAGLLQGTRLDETQRSYLQTLRDCGEHLLNLVNDVLDLAKLEAGRIELEPVETDVEKLLQGVVELLSPRAYASGLEIAWWVDPAVPLVQADEGRIRQILFNLAGNALKFSDAGGVIVSASLVARGEGTARVRFCVEDTGPGVPEAARRAVFGEFVQTEAGARAGGAGLGLAIVQRLADAFDGQVGVGAAETGGALFWFEAELTAAAPRPRGRGLGLIPIAVVSPSAIVRAAASRHIEASGGVALPAPDLKSASAEARLVLVDGALRRARPPEGRPAIILLAPEERRRLVKARALGYGGYLIKPLRRDSLVARVRASLGSEVFQAAARPLEDERASDLAGRGARVLLVEDNPVNALLAKALLTREGCSVERAASAGEALAAAARGPFDLVLMDVRLPDGDGRDAARELRGRGFAGAIVALTANSFEDDRQSCLAAGMTGFLTKPLSPHALRSALLEHCGPARAGGASDAEAGAPVRRAGAR